MLMNDETLAKNFFCKFVVEAGWIRKNTKTKTTAKKFMIYPNAINSC